MISTIRHNFSWTGLTEDIQRFVRSCRECQLSKKTASKEYGHLPTPNNITPEPWEQVNIDMIGPWSVEFTDPTNGIKTKRSLSALTMVDAETNFPEIVPTEVKTAESISTLFLVNWLYRYPKPSKVIHDNGGEFTGLPFQLLCHLWDIITS